MININYFNVNFFLIDRNKNRQPMKFFFLRSIIQYCLVERVSYCENKFVEEAIGDIITTYNVLTGNTKVAKQTKPITGQR